MTGDDRRAWDLMYQFVESQGRRAELAEALGFRLGGGRGKVLFGLAEAPKTLRTIAEEIGTDAPYATVVVDKLEAHGLVERRPHPEDRRRKLVHLTTAGVEAVRTAEAILHRPPHAMSRLDEDERRTLVRLMARLTDDDRS